MLFGSYKEKHYCLEAEEDKNSSWKVETLKDASEIISYWNFSWNLLVCCAFHLQPNWNMLIAL